MLKNHDFIPKKAQVVRKAASFVMLRADSPPPSATGPFYGVDAFSRILKSELYAAKPYSSTC